MIVKNLNLGFKVKNKKNLTRMFKSSFKKKPLVSVIMNCHNGEKYLDESIKSVLNQSYKNWEIIFFDNNSTDKSSLILRKYKNKKIKYFKSIKKHRLYKARNLAIKKSKGELISFLDVDDWWSKNKLSKQVAIFLKDETVDILYSNIYLYDEKKKTKKIYFKKNLNSGKITQKIIDKFEISILTTIIKKKIFEKIKFDNRYTIIGDFDFFVRLSLIKNIKVTQEPLAYHRMHSSNLTTNKTGLYIKELENWIKEKIKNKSFKFINFSKIYLLIQVLKIKYYMSVGNNLTAFKIVFQKPFYIYKLFKFLFFFLKYRK